MVSLIKCPQGHEWPAEDGWEPAGRATLTCPFCGQEALTLPPERERPSRWDGARETAGTEFPSGTGSLGDVPIPAGSSVPGFELLGELGRGGMGVVYRARQKGLNRLVALKMILSGAHAGAQELARFRAEAEAVARLQHPNIIQIYEIGDCEGQPFFALELVEGGPLSARLAGKPVPADEAARLAETLARAIHYAHGHGIVHRDLKPANILLSVVSGPLSVARSKGRLTTDNEPLTIPKITDFGLAKSVETGGASPGGPTRSGAVLGTPSYMAPEQALGKNREIGPAADVYALGAILYEMLTGRPPFVAATSLETLLQVVQDEPVPPRRLQGRLPIDLETICLKCLHKEPAKRYASAEALADDLHRFRSGEPILARPVGAAGRGWRWCRRNPVVAGLAAVLVLVVVGSLAGLTALYLRAEEQRAAADANRQAAEKNFADADRERRHATEAETQIRRELAKAQAAERFLVENLLAAPRPTDSLMALDRSISPNSMGPNATVKQVLDAAAPRIGEVFGPWPELEARMRQEVGNTYQNLGSYPAAIEQLRIALRLYEQSCGADHKDTVRAVSDLGLALKKQGELDEAEPLQRRALEGLRRRYGEAHVFTQTAYNNLAGLLLARGRLDEAEQILRRILTDDRRNDAQPQTLITLENLVGILEEKKDFENADIFRRRALTASEQAYGQDHAVTRLVRKGLNTAVVRRWNEQALQASAQGKYAEAEPLYQRALLEARSIWGPEDPETQTVLFNLAMALREQNKTDEAEPLVREVLRLLRTQADAKASPRLDTTLSLLGWVLTDRGKAAEAEPLLRECLALRQKNLPPGHWQIANTQNVLGACLAAQKKFAEAEPLLLEGCIGLEKARDSHPKRKREALERVVAFYEACGKKDQAAEWRKKLQQLGEARNKS